MRFIIGLLLLSTVFCSQVFFSPNGGTREQIINLIQTTTGNIDIAIFSFTSKELAMALLMENKKGRNIRIVADRGQGNGKYSALKLLREHVPVRYLPVSYGRGMMHHKFMLINKTYLVTGSYNWSTNAEKYNYENCLILDESKLITEYSAEYEKIWKEGASYDQLQ